MCRTFGGHTYEDELSKQNPKAETMRLELIDFITSKQVLHLMKIIMNKGNREPMSWDCCSHFLVNVTRYLTPTI